VEGSGKTTIGKLLAERVHFAFADADDFHSAANKEKMSKGIPLTDADRQPWLAAIRAQMLRWMAAKENAVITCSALKQSYRDFLISGRSLATSSGGGGTDAVGSADASRGSVAVNPGSSPSVDGEANPEGTSGQVKIVYLHGSFELIDERLRERTDHFAGEALLKSQFATLEEPHNAIWVEIDKTPEAIVDDVVQRLGLS
jgi:gluconokinase